MAQKCASCDAGATTQGRGDGAGGNIAVASRSAIKGNSPGTSGESAERS